jgi:lipopolysaccharide transport system ATP-binding protein
MSTSDLALRVEGLSKSYTIAHDDRRESTLAETLLNKLKRPGSRVSKETFWALRDVSFDVKKGDVVGIIGRNGAGKSTLLKILSRITEPTTGRIELFGRIGSLLEVGTGFHPELTGRENIYLNGAILGMRREEIRRQFDAIVDFSGVEKFLDTPVKRYSSGMYVRLAFAVAAHLNPEILIVDEVLAVGDAEFQKKCLGKMKDVASGGRTVLFVSHNMAAVASLCQRAVLLQAGSLIRQGHSQSILEAYARDNRKSEDPNRPESLRRSSTAHAIAASVTTVDGVGSDCRSFAVGAPVNLQIRYLSWPDFLRPTVMVGVILKTASGAAVGATNMRMHGLPSELCSPRGGTIHFRLSPTLLAPGEYCFDIYIGDGMSDADVVYDAAGFTVEATDFFGSGVAPFSQHGPLVLTGKWSHTPVHGSN